MLINVDTLISSVEAGKQKTLTTTNDASRSQKKGKETKNKR